VTFSRPSRPTVPTCRDRSAGASARVPDRCDDQDLGPHYGSDLKRQPNSATHVSLSPTDQVEGPPGLAHWPFSGPGAEDKDGHARVNLPYRLTTPLTGVTLPLTAAAGGHYFTCPSSRRDGTQRHHNVAGTPPSQRSDGAWRQGWNVTTVPYLSSHAGPPIDGA
jgi:hypothetical protein